ncbi:MAG: PilT/PilU family type 4a pilus ATPase [Actinobacteria bacterium]|nr:PilT/PilU family type 4a pilus ATPase [Actinomycetota bacterium]
MEIDELLNITLKKGASDLHLIVGYSPTLRIDGQLVNIPDTQPLTTEDIEKFVFSILNQEQKELFIANRELDLSHAIRGANFRVNIYYQRGTVSLAARLIPSVIKTIEELQLPTICHSFTKIRQGFILVTGPTGHGKSTTLAAIINEINESRGCHIVTIEDPIEYVYPSGKSIVSQREIRLDTHSWDMALRSALREDIDVVLIGEMRDYETIASALTIAETGHLVFATLHTNSSSQTIDRIVDVFPASQQPQIRLQLSENLEGIISQRLIPQVGGGRIPAVEILLATGAVKSTIREGKTHFINNIIQTSRDMGMETIETSLANFVKQGKINLDSALEFTTKPDEVIRLVKS